MPVVDFTDVEVKFGDHLVWSKGTFAIEKGSITVVVGPNGSGKSTLVKLILGLLKPTSGQIEVNTEQISYLPQSYLSETAEFLRAVDLVELGRSGQKFGWRNRNRDDVNKALDLVQASKFAKQRLSTLSGGQQQRVALASALVSQPDLLVLDEPFASLDATSTRDIVKLLAKLRDELGLTIVIVSHSLNELLPVVDNSIYLLDEHPHFVKSGSELEPEILEHLYGSHLKKFDTPQGTIYADDELGAHSHVD